MTKFQNTFIAYLLSAYMRSLGVGLFTTRTVGELLWGYQDNLLTSLQKLHPQLDDVFGLFYKVSVRRMRRYHRVFLKPVAGSWINAPSLLGFPHRATLPTTVSTSSSPGNGTTETLPEWTRGTVKGDVVFAPLTNQINSNQFTRTHLQSFM